MGPQGHRNSVEDHPALWVCSLGLSAGTDGRFHRTHLLHRRFVLGGHMAWIYLVVAGVFEWGWPVGLKYGMTDAGVRWNWIGFAALCMVLSGALLLMAQRTIPMGTAYAVWTGIGAVGTFLLGIALFQEPATLIRFFFVGLIVVGILGLKFASSS